MSEQQTHIRNLENLLKRKNREIRILSGSLSIAQERINLFTKTEDIFDLLRKKINSLNNHQTTLDLTRISKYTLSPTAIEEICLLCDEMDGLYIVLLCKDCHKRLS